MSLHNPAPAGPVPIQVVFQGGGAKLCLLMAVCSVLKKFEADGKIKIVRAAGSSAGAIAATMLASSKNLDTYKAELKAICTPYLARMSTSPWLGAWRVYRGEPYFKDLSLEDFFTELFSSDGGPRKLSDLRFETQLYYTDLFTLESRAAAPDDAISQALAKSCRFPFAFVGYNTDDTAVDGGLASNLPVDRLKHDESTKGSVIGISFKSAVPARPKNSLLSYTQQLFSAAIQHSVSRSEWILGPQNVFPIDTDIDTFDFEKAITDGLGIHYNYVAQQFQTWLENWLKAIPTMVPPSPTPVAPEPQVLLRPTLANAPFPKPVIRQLDSWLKSVASTNAVSVYMFEVAILDEAGAFTGKYRTRNYMTFDVVGSTNIVRFSFQTGHRGTFSDVNLGCAVTDSKGNPLDFVPHVQEVTRDGDMLRSFNVYFLFDKAISRDNLNQPFVLQYQYDGDDGYPELGKQMEVAGLTRWQGGAEEAILAVAFPKEKFKADVADYDLAALTPEQFARSKFALEPGEELVASQRLDRTELVAMVNLEPSIGYKYVLVGRRVENIKQGQCFGLAVE